MEEHSGPGEVGNSDDSTSLSPARSKASRYLDMLLTPARPGPDRIKPEDIAALRGEPLNWKQQAERATEQVRWLSDRLAEHMWGKKLWKGPDPFFPERYAETYWRLFDINGAEPDQERLADEFGMDRSTLWRRRKRYSVPEIPQRPGA